MQLDETDRRILRVLQREGRISNADLAERIALSPSACHRRVQRLEVDGFVAGYVEIKLSSQSDEVLDAFERAVARIPDVLECHLMAGNADFLLKLMVEDTEDFARIHRQYLARLPGVAQMQSSFALRTVVRTTALDL